MPRGSQRCRRNRLQRQTDEGRDPLGSLQGLEELDLSGTRTTPQGVDSTPQEAPEVPHFVPAVAGKALMANSGRLTLSQAGGEKSLVTPVECLRKPTVSSDRRRTQPAHVGRPHRSAQRRLVGAHRAHRPTHRNGAARVESERLPFLQHPSPSRDGPGEFEPPRPRSLISGINVPRSHAKTPFLGSRRAQTRRLRETHRPRFRTRRTRPRRRDVVGRPFGAFWAYWASVPGANAPGY
jgi:hypothetical protein